MYHSCSWIFKILFENKNMSFTYQDVECLRLTLMIHSYFCKCFWYVIIIRCTNLYFTSEKLSRYKHLGVFPYAQKNSLVELSWFHIVLGALMIWVQRMEALLLPPFQIFSPFNLLVLSQNFCPFKKPKHN
jgi:hypothetical protein